MQMPQVKLGKIEPVPVREVWPHEALNFTKWLAEEENLAQLGDACSIDLELVDTESAVGSFAVDIFAKETGSDRRVVIENQLEDTNHDHLGKIITYAAGKGADVVIWVVARARDEHRRAIEWLNEHTDDECSFFLVEIEVWRIGDSPMAPRFNVVESPNEWARAEKAKDGLSDTKSAQLGYWQAYREAALSDPDFSKVMRPRKARAQHWSDVNVGSSRYHLCMLAVVQGRRIGVEICISNDKDFGKVVFDHQQELEQLLGAKGDPYDAKKSCGIRFYRENCDVKGKPEMWGDYIAWQLHAAVLLREAIIGIDEAYLAEADE